MEFKEYPPKEFCRKYGHLLAPDGVKLLPPDQAFSRYHGADSEAKVKTARALRVILKRLNSTYKRCIVCDTLTGRTYGQLDGSCDKCHVICCSLQCAVIGQLSEKHSVLCSAVYHQRVDQFVECLPVPINVFRSLDSRTCLNRSSFAPDRHSTWHHWFTSTQNVLQRCILEAPPTVLAWRDFAASKVEFFQHISAIDVENSLRRLATGVASLPLTIAHGIHQFNLSKQRQLCIHLIGADCPEVTMVTTNLWQLISPAAGHLRQKMQLVMVSPDSSVKQLSRTASLHQPLQLGRGRQKRDGGIEVIAWDGLYHHFHAVHVDRLNDGVDIVQEPHLICCIHPGAHTDELFAIWRPTLQLILRRNYPVVMTTYNEQEFDGTLEKLDSLNVNYIFKGVNPFGSCHLKQTPVDKTLVWSNNAYLILFRGISPHDDIKTSEIASKRLS